MKQVLLVLLLLSLLTPTLGSNIIVVRRAAAGGGGPVYTPTDDCTALTNWNDDVGPTDSAHSIYNSTECQWAGITHGLASYATATTDADQCVCAKLTHRTGSDMGVGVMFRGGSDFGTGYVLLAHAGTWGGGDFFISPYEGGTYYSGNLGDVAYWDNANSPPGVGDYVCVKISGGTSSTSPVIEIWKNPSSGACTGTCDRGYDGDGTHSCTASLTTDAGFHSSLQSGTWQNDYCGWGMMNYDSSDTARIDDFYCEDP